MASRSIRIQVDTDDRAGQKRLERLERSISLLEARIARDRALRGESADRLRQQTAELERQEAAAGEIRRTMVRQSTEALPKLRESMAFLTAGFDRGTEALARYSLGMRELFGLFDSLRGLLTGSVRTLVQYGGETRSSIGGLRTALDGLQRSLAAAFAPVAHTVVPILTELIDWLADAVSAVSMFFAVLSGNATYKKAVRGLNDTAAAASSAVTAAKAAARNLSGLDELNIWNSGSSGAGGGGRSGRAGGGLEFVDERAEDLASFWKRLAENLFQDGLLDFSSVSLIVDDGDDGWLNKRVRELRAKVEQAVQNVFQGEPVELPSVIAAPEEDAWERLREGIREKVREPVAVPAAIRVPDSAVEGLKSTVTSAVNRLFAGEPVAVPAAIRVPATATETITDELASQEPVVTTATIRTPSTATETITDDLASQEPVVTPLTIRTPANATSEIAEELAKQDPVTLPAAIQVKAVDISEEEIDHLRSSVNEAFSRAFGGSGDSEAIEIPGPTLAENIFMAAVGSAFFPGWLESLLGGSPEGALGGFAADAGFDLDAFLEEHQLGEGEGRGGRLVGRYAMDETPRIPVIAEIDSFDDRISDSEKVSKNWKGVFQYLSKDWNASDWTKNANAKGFRAVFTSLGKDWNTADWTKNANAKGFKAFFTSIGKDWNITDWKNNANASGWLAKFTSVKDDIAQKLKKVDGVGAGISAVTNEMKWNGSSNGWLSGIGAGIAAVTNAMRWDGAGYGTVSGVAAGIKSFEDQIPWYDKLLYHFKAVIDQYSNNGNQLASGGVFTGGAWRPIQSYASGGYVGGQLFVAREAGPELVGTLKGHTAVMNNDQIVSSVAAGVARAISNIRFRLAGLPAYPAVTPGMMPAMAAGTVIPPGILRSEEDIGGIRDAVGRILDRLESLNAGGTGDISVNARVRERTLFEVVIEQGRLYKARTGRSPFDV